MLSARSANLAAIGLLLLLCATVPGQAPAQATPPEAGVLAGVWGTELSLGRLVRGALTIDGREPDWRASIAGFDVPVQLSGDELRFDLPDGLGEFRGYRDRSAGTVDGDWVQPAGIVNRTRYASPVHLAALSPPVYPPLRPGQPGRSLG